MYDKIDFSEHGIDQFSRLFNSDCYIISRIFLQRTYKDFFVQTLRYTSIKIDKYLDTLKNSNNMIRIQKHESFTGANHLGKNTVKRPPRLTTPNLNEDPLCMASNYNNNNKNSVIIDENMSLNEIQELSSEEDIPINLKKITSCMAMVDTSNNILKNVHNI